jgi:hypothetical protein
MNGRIWAESEYKKGSTFYLEIPRISHEEATSLIEKAAEAAPSVSTPIQSAAIAQTAPSAPPVAQPAPSPIPTYEQQPAPTFQQPAPQPLQPQVPISPPPAVTRPNIPLTSIEQTPSAYTQQFGDGRPQSVNIPPRDQQ